MKMEYTEGAWSQKSKMEVWKKIIVGYKSFYLLSGFILFGHIAQAQQSVARQWNETLLEGIRGDFARPTVHARNLFHISAAMYDAWAIFSDESDPYLIGGTVKSRLSRARTAFKDVWKRMGV